MDYEKQVNRGYFDPSDFTSILAQVRGTGKLGSTRNSYTFGVDTGLQSFTRNGVSVSGDFVLILHGSLTFPLRGGFAIDAFAHWGNYAGLTASGFESREIGVRLLWTGGG